MAQGFRGAAAGYVADQKQLLEIVVNGLEVYNQTVDPVISELAEPVYKETLRVSQAPIQFNRHGEGASPEAQRQTFREITAPLEDWDAGIPFSVTGLQDALPSDVQATIDGIMAGDTERMEQEFFKCLFTKRTAGGVGTAYRASFWSGETDVPSYKQNSHFGSAHNHYKGLSTTTLALSHLQEASRDIREHGYGTRPGSLVAYFHSDQNDDIENLLNITVSSSLTTSQRVTAQDEGGFNTGIMFAGISIVINDNVPTGYFCVVDRTVRPLAMRQHAVPEYRGLQMFAETMAEGYPLAGKKFLNRFGFVVQRCGAGTARQLVGSGTYTNPTWRLDS